MVTDMICISPYLIIKILMHNPGKTMNLRMFNTFALNLISTFYYYHWVDTSAGGLLVPEGNIRPVVSASALT